MLRPGKIVPPQGEFAGSSGIESAQSAASVGRALPKRRDLAARPAGAEMLVRDPATSTVHFLSATAAQVWECCDGKTTASECAGRLRSAFAVPAEIDLEGDVRETVDDFARRGLLEGQSLDLL